MIKISTSACCTACEKWLDYNNGEFVCSHCGKVVKQEEIKYSLADWYELNIPYTSRKFNNRLTQLQELTSKYNATFLGFDEFDSIGANNFSGMLDIGWDDAFPDTLPQFIKELKRILR